MLPTLPEAAPFGKQNTEISEPGLDERWTEAEHRAEPAESEVHTADGGQNRAERVSSLHSRQQTDQRL